MFKSQELTNVDSCFNKAGMNERIFVLLARDKAAPYAIRAWVVERIRMELNSPNDPQIKEALECANLMEKER